MEEAFLRVIAMDYNDLWVFQMQYHKQDDNMIICYQNEPNLFKTDTLIRISNVFGHIVWAQISKLTLLTSDKFRLQKRQIVIRLRFYCLVQMWIRSNRGAMCNSHGYEYVTTCLMKERAISFSIRIPLAYLNQYCQNKDVDSVGWSFPL